jgi:DNA-binding CsgD family transcriptional regulator
VRSYTENAMRKLDAHNRVHAVAVALRLGLIS